MKHKLWLTLLLALLAVLGGCRTRTVSDPAQADTVAAEASALEEPAPSASPRPSATPSPSPSPSPSRTPEREDAPLDDRSAELEEDLALPEDLMLPDDLELSDDFPMGGGTPAATNAKAQGGTTIADEPLNLADAPMNLAGPPTGGGAGSGVSSTGLPPGISLEETTPSPRPSPAPTVAPSASPAPSPAATEDPEPSLLPGSVTVTLDPNGGESGTYTLTLEPGGVYGALPEAVCRGWRFDGWWTDPKGGASIAPDTVVTETADHTLYAHWAPQLRYTVTLDGNGGRVKARESALSLSDGDAYGALPTPLREGYEFLGWFTDPVEGEAITPETVFAGGGDQTLYAHWYYDAYGYWSFTLINRTQQVYLCQQSNIYIELGDGVTEQVCGLISDTGSLNVAENRADPNVDDDWVLAKNPDVILRLAENVYDEDLFAALRARFPDKEIILVTSEALEDGAAGLYARLALAQHLYADWYLDVDLPTAAAELGVVQSPISLT